MAQLRRLPEAGALLAALDTPGLLAGRDHPAAPAGDLDEDALLAELGLGDSGGSTDATPDATPHAGDIRQLRHVRSHAEKRAAEEVAARTPCADFTLFQPLFEEAERGLKTGERQTLRFGRNASIAVSDFFILGGQLAYVAGMGETYRTPNNETNARLRVIFSNGTESDLLLRSLQRALYKDKTGRRLTRPGQGPLFGDAPQADDIESGTIYVLRSLSDHPYVADNRALIHKIGVTGGSVESRIAGASRDATYLLAGVEVVATYRLHNLNRTRVEGLFHRLFGAAQLDLEIQDRFGQPVKPREWFLVPLQAIDEAVQRIVDGSITAWVYDPALARLRPANSADSADSEQPAPSAGPR